MSVAGDVGTKKRTTEKQQCLSWDFYYYEETP